MVLFEELHITMQWNLTEFVFGGDCEHLSGVCFRFGDIFRDGRSFGGDRLLMKPNKITKIAYH